MSSQKNRRVVSYITTFSALACLSFAYQNCARAKFDIDPSAKAAALGDENVFGVDPTAVVPDPTGVDPSTGDNSGGGGGNETTGVDPTLISTSYGCSDKESIAIGTNVIESAALKVVVLNKSNVKVCELSGDFRTQILNKKSFSLTPCAGLADGSYTALVVDAKVAGDYAKKSLTGSDLKFAVSGSKYKFSRVKVEITYDLNDQHAGGLANNHSTKDTQAKCDSRHSPLIISMNSKARGIKLTAPMDGIQFDILGQRSLPMANAKKQISWLAEGKDYYFITLPHGGAVNGIDEMFGDNTRGPDGKYADNGYAALAKYDDNGDGLITKEDAIYSQLR
jgi:hypothetical protein